MTDVELATIFREAQAQANAAAPGDDGGTCNMDGVVIQPGRQSWLLKRAMTKAGLSQDASFKWLGASTYFLHLNYSGQGNQRARMSSAAYKHIHAALKGSDFVVWHWQQMD